MVAQEMIPLEDKLLFHPYKIMVALEMTLQHYEGMVYSIYLLMDRIDLPEVLREVSACVGSHLSTPA